jgi:hypothetical protein
MRDQDVQNREGLKLVLRVAEPLKGWVSVHKDTQPFTLLLISGLVVMLAHSKDCS